MYQASNVEHLLRAIMGIRAHPRLTNGKTSLGHHGTQSLGCAGQTVRPSLHSISQTSVGKLSILNYSVSVLMFDVSRITCSHPLGATVARSPHEASDGGGEGWRASPW